jgi:alpha-L-fucosidase 2
MLLQSHNGIIRVFPAVPADWKDISFENLRTEGAFLVSATRKRGRVGSITIRSERGGVARVKSPWRNKIVTLPLKPRQTVWLMP